MLNNYHVKDVVNKYYDVLEEMINDLASVCMGGEQATITFPAGKVTIELK